MQTYQVPTRYFINKQNLSTMVELALSKVVRQLPYYDMSKRIYKTHAYYELVDQLIDAFLMDYLFERCWVKSPVTFEYAFFRLLSYMGSGMDGREIELTDEFITEMRLSLSSFIPDDKVLNKYSEWSIIKQANLYVIEWLGDYRIRRYHEAVKHGVFTE